MIFVARISSSEIRPITGRVKLCIAAASESEARQRLEDGGLLVSGISSLGDGPVPTDVDTLEEQRMVLARLVTLVERRLDLISGLDDLRDALPPGPMRLVLDVIRGQLEGGVALPDALACFPQYFTPDYVHALRQVPEDPEYRAFLDGGMDLLELRRQFFQAIRNSVLYGKFVLVFGLTTLGFLGGFAGDAIETTKDKLNGDRFLTPAQTWMQYALEGLLTFFDGIGFFVSGLLAILGWILHGGLASLEALGVGRGLLLAVFGTPQEYIDNAWSFGTPYSEGLGIATASTLLLGLFVFGVASYPLSGTREFPFRWFFSPWDGKRFDCYQLAWHLSRLDRMGQLNLENVKALLPTMVTATHFESLKRAVFQVEDLGADLHDALRESSLDLEIGLAATTAKAGGSFARSLESLLPYYEAEFSEAPLRAQRRKAAIIIGVGAFTGIVVTLINLNYQVLVRALLESL